MKKKLKPAQKQKRQPGIESKMRPLPKFEDPDYEGSHKLRGKVAIITGGDSGIGRAVAIAFAIEGAHVVITYLNEHRDATYTLEKIKEKGQEGLAIAGDTSEPKFCHQVVAKTIKRFNKVDILVNNVAEQHPQNNFLDITPHQLEKTFNTNVFSYFYMTRAVFPYLEKNSVIINTASVTAYKGSDHLVDYSATKGAIVAFTRSLSAQLVAKGIRVNGVAPGPIWTPLIPASFSAKHVAEFGGDVPMKRPGEPKEVAPCYVFLASEDSSYMSGQILHPNGGVIVNG